MTHSGPEVEASKPSEEGKLAHFPDIIEDDGPEKNVRHHRTAWALPPEPPQKCCDRRRRDRQEETQHRGGTIQTLAHRVNSSSLCQRCTPQKRRQSAKPGNRGRTAIVLAYNRIRATHYNPKGIGMVGNLWLWIVLAPHRYRLTVASKMLLCLLFGILALGQTGMGCHDDCWLQKPPWHPVAILQDAPVLPPPQPWRPRFMPDTGVLIAHEAYKYAFLSRAPPVAL